MPGRTRTLASRMLYPTGFHREREPSAGPCQQRRIGANSIGVDARVTPLDPPGKSEARTPNGGTAEL